jgi:hypothetical protein
MIDGGHKTPKKQGLTKISAKALPVVHPDGIEITPWSK